MTTAKPPVLPALLGFALIALPFAAGMAATLSRGTPPLVAEDPAAAGTEDGTAAPMKVYLPLPEPLVLNLRGERSAVLSLTLAVEGPAGILVGLKATVEARMDDLMARILAEAQAVAERDDAPTALRHNLPARLRDTLNAAVGTEPLPEPVREVLVTEFMLR